MFLKMIREMVPLATKQQMLQTKRGRDQFMRQCLYEPSLVDVQAQSLLGTNPSHVAFHRVELDDQTKHSLHHALLTFEPWRHTVQLWGLNISFEIQAQGGPPRQFVKLWTSLEDNSDVSARLVADYTLFLVHLSYDPTQEDQWFSIPFNRMQLCDDLQGPLRRFLCKVPAPEAISLLAIRANPPTAGHGREPTVAHALRRLSDLGTDRCPLGTAAPADPEMVRQMKRITCLKQIEDRTFRLKDINGQTHSFNLSNAVLHCNAVQRALLKSMPPNQRFTEKEPFEMQVPIALTMGAVCLFDNWISYSRLCSPTLAIGSEHLLSCLQLSHALEATELNHICAQLCAAAILLERHRSSSELVQRIGTVLRCCSLNHYLDIAKVDMFESKLYGLLELYALLVFVAIEEGEAVREFLQKEVGSNALGVFDELLNNATVALRFKQHPDLRATSSEPIKSTDQPANQPIILSTSATAYQQPTNHYHCQSSLTPPKPGYWAPPPMERQNPFVGAADDAMSF